MDQKQGSGDKKKWSVLQCALEKELSRFGEDLNMRRKRKELVITSHSWDAKCLVFCLLWGNFEEGWCFVKGHKVNSRDECQWDIYVTDKKLYILFWNNGNWNHQYKWSQQAKSIRERRKIAQYGILRFLNWRKFVTNISINWLLWDIIILEYG